MTRRKVNILRLIDTQDPPSFRNSEAFSQWYTAQTQNIVTPRVTCVALTDLQRIIIREAPVALTFVHWLETLSQHVPAYIAHAFAAHVTDEQGQSDLAHRDLFLQTAELLGIAPDVLTIPDQPSLGFQVYATLSTQPQLLGHALGFFGYMEAVGAQYARWIVEQGDRFGVSLPFYALHEQLDQQHAQEWLHDMILPCLAMGDVTIDHLVSGVQLAQYVNATYASELTDLLDPT